MIIVVRMVVTIAAMGVLVSIKEPEDSDKEGAEEDEQSLNPLLVAFLELGGDDLCTRDIEEGTTGKASMLVNEDDINKTIDTIDAHANEDSKRCCKGEENQENNDLFRGVACACKCTSKRDSGGPLMDQDACSKLTG